MNNTFSLEQLSKTGNLVTKSFLGQYKLSLKSKVMETKSTVQKITQKNSAALRLFRFLNLNS